MLYNPPNSAFLFQTDDKTSWTRFYTTSKLVGMLLALEELVQTVGMLRRVQELWLMKLCNGSNASV